MLFASVCSLRSTAQQEGLASHRAEACVSQAVLGRTQFCDFSPFFFFLSFHLGGLSYSLVPWTYFPRTKFRMISSRLYGSDKKFVSTWIWAWCFRGVTKPQIPTSPLHLGSSGCLSGNPHVPSPRSEAPHVCMGDRPLG